MVVDGRSGGGGGGPNRPTHDTVQVERIRRIVQREILDRRRRLFPAGRWPSDGVSEPLAHPQPYTTAMKFAGRDPSTKKKAGITKRPPNMWMIFRMHAASVVMEEFPEVNQAALTSVLAPIWQTAITPQEKELVRRESERLKEFHKLQFPEWKYRPRQKKRQASAAADKQATVHRQSAVSSVSSSSSSSRSSSVGRSIRSAVVSHRRPSVSCCLPPASPDDRVDGLDPLSVDTDDQVICELPDPDCSGACGGSPWGRRQQQQQQQQHDFSDCMPFCSPVQRDKDPLLRSILEATPQQQQQQQSHHQQLSCSLSTDAASAPSSVSSDLAALPDILPDYLADFVLPDYDSCLPVADLLPIKSEFGFAVL